MPPPSSASGDDDDVPHRWFCARTVFRFHAHTYEERLTLWQAQDFDTAIGLAEAEASDYASSLEGCLFTGLVQAFELFEPPGHGAEVFSLMRDSALSPADYVGAFFATGTERT